MKTSSSVFATLLTSFLIPHICTAETAENSFTEKAPEILDKIVDGLKTAKDKTLQAASKVNEEINSSKSRRAADAYLIGLNYSWFDMILPGKQGLTLGSIQGAKTTWELEYLTSSLAIGVDKIGSMTDERVSLIKRSFGDRNSFNIFYGLNYFNFAAELNQELLTSVDPNLRHSANRIQIQSLGLNFGLSNRWTFSKFNKHFNFTVDWFNISQPLYITYKNTAFLDYSTNPNDAHTVKTVVDIFSYIPRLSGLKLQLGMSF